MLRKHLIEDDIKFKFNADYPLVYLAIDDKGEGVAEEGYIC